MADTTRAQSPKKPTDHQPKAGEMVTVTFRDKDYTFDARHTKDSRTLLSIRKGALDEAIARMLSPKDFEAILTSIEDEDGFSELDELGEFIDAAFEAGGAKNS